jgi:hypothetical protein
LDFSKFDFDANTAGIQGAVNGLQLVNAAPATGQMVEDTFYYDAASGRLSLSTDADGQEDFHVTLNVAVATSDTGHPNALTTIGLWNDFLT